MGPPQLPLSKESKDLEASLARHDYDSWLLEDHPLRSHPTQCIPGLGSFLVDWYISRQNRRAGTLFRAVALVLACSTALVILYTLPFPPRFLSHSASTPYDDSRGWQAACTFPHSDPRPSALTQSLAAGCDGYRTDLWLHEDELLIGVADSGAKAASHLHSHLNSLLTRLEPQAPSTESQSAMNADTGNPEDNLQKTFTLVLNVKSNPLDVYPHLFSQLDTLRQRGYLTHWDGTALVRRPVTVVIAGEYEPIPDCTSYSSADVFQVSGADDISSDGVSREVFPPFVLYDACWTVYYM